MKVTTGGFGPLGLIVVVVVILGSAFVVIGALYYNWKNNERYVILP
jgi:hypothetical protein